MLLNNRHLQATFEDLGIAQADFVQSGLLKNPVFDLGVRFPDRSPSKTYLDLSITSDFIELFLIPARRKLAGLALQQARLRVTERVLATVSQTRQDFYRYQAAAQLLELRNRSPPPRPLLPMRPHDSKKPATSTRCMLAEQTQDVRAKVEQNDAEAELATAKRSTRTSASRPSCTLASRRPARRSPAR